MEFPARIVGTLPKRINGEKNVTEKGNSLVRIDPYRGNWGLRLLELELSNPTDVVFEVNVSVQLQSQPSESGVSIFNNKEIDFGYRKTRIDRDYSARVLIPLENFKLPVLDVSFFSKDTQVNVLGNALSTPAERNAKAELNATINNLISKIKVRWHSGRNSSGELNIRDATQAALQASVMDILLPDPLSFGFRLAEIVTTSENIGSSEESNTEDSSTGQTVEITGKAKDSISAHEMTRMEVIIQNNTKEKIRTSLSVSCRDVAGENCFEGHNATVLWAGVLNDIHLEAPPLQEIRHSFALYFLVPGEYALLAAAVINDATDVLRARAKSDSSNDPIFCYGSPFHIHVAGAV